MSAKLKLALIISLASVTLIFGNILASSEEYVIGPGDVLKVSFWQDPSLDQEVQVRHDGKITLSIIGEIEATGFTSQQLADRIERNVSLYNTKVSQAAVTVIAYRSQRVFVSGMVSMPGKYSFEVIPDLWTVIKEAGGATETGDLSRVTIIRSRERGGEIITVNILEAIATGKVDQLPKLESDDTVEIPRVPGGVPGRQLASEYEEKRNLYYVIGQVNAPGIKAYEENIDILDAIGTASGTTSDADLTKVSVISKNGQGTSMMKLDLTKDQERGRARRVMVKPEDMIIVAQKKRAFLGWGTLRDVLAVAGTIASLYLVIENNNN